MISTTQLRGEAGHFNALIIFLWRQVGRRVAVQLPAIQESAAVTSIETPATIEHHSLKRLQLHIQTFTAILLCGAIAGAPAFLAWLRLPTEHRSRASWQDVLPAAMSAVCVGYCAHPHLRGASSICQGASRSNLTRTKVVMLCISLILAAAEVWGLPQRCLMLSWSITIVTFATLLTT